MPADARVPIRPDSVLWAMQRTGMDEETLAKRLSISPKRLQAWLRGKEKPTYKQAASLAKKLHVGFTSLLLPPPRKIELPIRDLRVGKNYGAEPSPELLEIIYDALRKRDWYRQYRGYNELPFVGRFNWQQATPERVAEDICKVIDFGAVRQKSGNWDGFLTKAVTEIEKAGILVLRSGIVGSNTSRGLSPEEASGFAIADPVAPIIFVNAKDSVARRNFTLVHELAHIWVGQDALDNYDDESAPNFSKGLERFCDQVAANVLMPAEMFAQAWQDDPEYAARRFKVSVLAVLVRALELGHIEQNDFAYLYKEALERSKQERKGKPGGNFDVSLPARNSPTFTRAVVGSLQQGDLSYREAASLLGVSLKGLMGYLERGQSEPISR